MRMATNFVFTHMQDTTGFNLFGQKVVAEMFKELKQLEQVLMPEKLVLHVLDPDMMTPEEKKKL